MKKQWCDQDEVQQSEIGEALGATTKKDVCPSCNGRGTLLYVQRVYEYHSMVSLPDEEGYCDLNAIEDTKVDDSFTPYLLCEKCNNKFNLDLTPTSPWWWPVFLWQ